MLYPPKGDTQYLTRGSIDTLSIYCVSKSLEPFKNLTGFSIFFFLEMFYPPKGDTQYLTRGSIDTLSIYCVSKSLEPFKNLTGFSIFFFLEMFYCGWAGWDG